MTLVAKLREMGFTEVEAKAYLALVEAGQPLSGYEVAKLAGVPRPNIYPALQHLARRGAVVEAVGEGPPRYRATPFGAIARAALARLADNIRALEAALDRPWDRSDTCHARGPEALWVHATDLIRRAQATLTVGATPLLARFAPALHEARARGLAVRYLCLAGCPPEGCGVCGTPRGHIDPPGGRVPEWLVLVRDGEEMLAASGPSDAPDIVMTRLAPIVFGLEHLVRLAGAQPPPSSGPADRVTS
jgi:predicted transcriptional regulator